MTHFVWNFCFETVVGVEGGFQNDERDRGNWTSGKVGCGQCKGTKYGICAMSYPYLDICNLTLDEAKDIYRKDYWERCKCDFIPDALSLAVFDFAVNSGIKTAVKQLQLALGVTADSVFGNQTLCACNRLPTREVLDRYVENRLVYLHGLKSWKFYGNGWGTRVKHVKEICERLL